MRVSLGSEPRRAGHGINMWATQNMRAIAAAGAAGAALVLSGCATEESTAFSKLNSEICDLILSNQDEVKNEFKEFSNEKNIHSVEAILIKSGWKRVDFQRLQTASDKLNNSTPSRGRAKRFIISFQKKCKISDENANIWSSLFYVENETTIKDATFWVNINDENFLKRNIHLTPQLTNSSTFLNEILLELTQQDFEEWNKLRAYLEKGGFKVSEINDLTSKSYTKDKTYRIEGSRQDDFVEKYYGVDPHLHTVIYVNDDNQVSRIGAKSYSEIIKEKERYDR